MTMPDESLRRQYLKAMGIDVWVARNTVAGAPGQVAATPTPEPGPGEPPPQSVAAEPDWADLERRIKTCTDCVLCQQRIQAVPGIGDIHAELMIVGEAPGADEDRQGEPFVGRAGKLLTNMLLAIGFTRDQVYITNIVKCRPPQNRDPEPEEAQECMKYLRKQIAWIRPKMILAVGRVAAQNLLGSEAPVGTMRGKTHYYEDTGIPVVVTYHPSYLLRKPLEKRKAWTDLQYAMTVYGKPVGHQVGSNDPA
jgi:DNA polymerase